MVSSGRYEVLSLGEEGYPDLSESFVVSDDSWLDIDAIRCSSKALRRLDGYMVSFQRYEVPSVEEECLGFSEFFFVSADSSPDFYGIRWSPNSLERCEPYILSF